jgi:hypothetical protein
MASELVLPKIDPPALFVTLPPLKNSAAALPGAGQFCGCDAPSVGSNLGAVVVPELLSVPGPPKTTPEMNAFASFVTVPGWLPPKTA